MAKKKQVDIPSLVGFTKLMELHREHAADMAVARVANHIVVSQFRAGKAIDANRKPNKKIQFWIYGVREGERVNRSLINSLTQRIDSMAKRFGQKVSWGRNELDVVEYNGVNYIVKDGRVRDVLQLLPPEEVRMRTISGDYNIATSRLKKAGISLKDARKLFEE